MLSTTSACPPFLENMNAIKEINRINQRELELGLAGKGSWHDEYKDSAYVFVGGLALELTEGDVITIMSQFGEVVDINLPRDKETGKTRGFGFVMYEDQRSTILAVDNLNGAQVLGRSLRVDHCRKYNQPGTKNKDGEHVAPEEPTYNAMPPIIDGSDDSDSEESAEEADDLDDEDPMAAFIRAEKKKAKLEAKGGDKKKHKRKHEGETKEERRARKEAKRAKRAEKERKKESRRDRDTEISRRQRLLDDDMDRDREGRRTQNDGERERRDRRTYSPTRSDGGHSDRRRDLTEDERDRKRSKYDDDLDRSDRYKSRVASPEFDRQGSTGRANGSRSERQGSREAGGNERWPVRRGGPAESRSDYRSRDGRREENQRNGHDRRDGGHYDNYDDLKDRRSEAHIRSERRDEGRDDRRDRRVEREDYSARRQDSYDDGQARRRDEMRDEGRSDRRDESRRNAGRRDERRDYERDRYSRDERYSRDDRR